jgi:hypothetical protein
LLYTYGWNAQSERHEKTLTDLLFALRPHRATRRNVCRWRKPDAEIWLWDRLDDGTDILQHFWVELNMGVTSTKWEELQGVRFPKYHDTDRHPNDAPVLWCVFDESPETALIHMKAMRDRAGAMREPWFTTTYRLFADPYGEVWTTPDDRQIALPDYKPSTLPETLVL